MNALCVVTKGWIKGGDIAVATKGMICVLGIVEVISYPCRKLVAYLDRKIDIYAKLEN
jgi:hypothetical protein